MERMFSLLFVAKKQWRRFKASNKTKKQQPAADEKYPAKPEGKADLKGGDAEDDEHTRELDFVESLDVTISSLVLFLFLAHSLTLLVLPNH